MTDESIVTDDFKDDDALRHEQAVEQYGMTPREEKLSQLLGDIDVAMDDVEDTEIHAAPEVKQSNVYQNGDGVEVIKLKVNGEEIEKPLSQAIAELQKNEAADRRLREAAETQRQLDEYAKRLQVEAQSLELKRAQADRQPAIDLPDRATIKQTLDAIYNGDDTAAEQFEQLLATRTTPNVDPDLITKQATLNAVQQMQAQMEQARFNQSLTEGQQWFEENYADIDPEVKAFIDYKTNDVARKNPGLLPDQIIKRATEESLSILKLSNAPSTRSEAKKNLTAPIERQHTSSRPAPVDNQDEEETPQQIRDRMMNERAATRNHRY